MRQENLDRPEQGSAALPVVTSDSDPIRVDFLPEQILPSSGRLGMTIAPGKCNIGMQALWQRDLQKDLKRLRHHYRVDLLITLLQPSELGQLAIPDLLDQIQIHDMQNHWFPIQDFGTPTSMAGLIELVETIWATVNRGKTVVIHCKAGLGRSGLVTASCLVALGYSPEAAFKQVRRARPGSVETSGQEQYVTEFAQAWLSAKRSLMQEHRYNFPIEQLQEEKSLG